MTERMIDKTRDAQRPYVTTLMGKVVHIARQSEPWRMTWCGIRWVDFYPWLPPRREVCERCKRRALASVEREVQE